MLYLFAVGFIQNFASSLFQVLQHLILVLERAPDIEPAVKNALRRVT
jgi:hypothetical protein